MHVVVCECEWKVYEFLLRELCRFCECVLWTIIICMDCNILTSYHITRQGIITIRIKQCVLLSCFLLPIWNQSIRGEVHTVIIVVVSWNKKKEKSGRGRERCKWKSLSVLKFYVWCYKMFGIQRKKNVLSCMTLRSSIKPHHRHNHLTNEARQKS